MFLDPKLSNTQVLRALSRETVWHENETLQNRLLRSSKQVTEHNKPSVLGFHHSTSLECAPRLPEFIPPQFNDVPIVDLLEKANMPGSTDPNAENSPWTGSRDLNFWILVVVDKFLQAFLKEESGIPYVIKAMLKLVVDKAEKSINTKCHHRMQQV